MTSDEAKRGAYKLLDSALPLQHKQTSAAKSLWGFVIEEPGELKETVTETEELSKVNDGFFQSKRDVHQIG